MAMKMKTMMAKAEKNGYAGRLSTTTLSLKTYGCMACRKNIAVKFVHDDESHAVLACLCGWRKRTTNLR
jgi:hypothetical protein